MIDEGARPTPQPPWPPPTVGTDVEEPSGGLGRRALVNTFQLGGSLIASWVMSLVGRFILPRVLGTERFGELTLMEGVAALTLSLMAFGVHEFIAKEVAVDPDAATRFARPLFNLQLLTGVVLAVAVGLVVLAVSGPELAIVAATFGLAQVNIILARVFASYLQARQEAAAVSVSAIATKTIWLVLLLAILGAGPQLMALPLALMVSEFVRVVWLGREFFRRFGRPDDAPVRAATGVLRKSVPHYINQLNVDVMGQSVRILVGVLGGVTAAGLFSSALLVASVPMLLVPVIGWVSIPMFASVRATDASVMWERVGTVTDSLAIVSLGIGVFLFALSDTIVTVLFGDDFAAAGPAFAWLAMSVPATYFTTVVGCALIADERSWQNTKVNFWTMILVVGSAVAVLLVDSGAEQGQFALRAAVVVTVGEWITVAILFAVRPYRVLAGASVVRSALLVGFLAVAAVEKIGGDSMTLRIVAAVGAVLILLSDLPRLRTFAQELLG